MSLLVSGVLGDEVQVFAADDEGAVHLRADDGAGQDTAADGDHAREGTLLVCKASHISMSEPQICGHPSCRHASFLHIPQWPYSDGIPMYLPSTANLGVRKPRPTSLYHRLPPLPTFVARAALEPFLWLRKTCGCFWKARSLWTVNSVAMIADVQQSEVLARNCCGDGRCCCRSQLAWWASNSNCKSWQRGVGGRGSSRWRQVCRFHCFDPR